MPPSCVEFRAVTGSDVMEEDCAGDVAIVDAIIESRRMFVILRILVILDSYHRAQQ